MATLVFYSFHYKPDNTRAARVRSMGASTTGASGSTTLPLDCPGARPHLKQDPDSSNRLALPGTCAHPPGGGGALRGLQLGQAPPRGR